MGEEWNTYIFSWVVNGADCLLVRDQQCSLSQALRSSLSGPGVSCGPELDRQGEA